MRRSLIQFWLTFLLWIVFAVSAAGYKSVEFNTLPSEVKMLTQDNFGITFQVDIQKINFYDVSTPEGVFTLARIPGMGRSFNIGDPVCLWPAS